MSVAYRSGLRSRSISGSTLIEHRHGLRHVALAPRDVREVLGRPYFEQLVATRPGARAHARDRPARSARSRPSTCRGRSSQVERVRSRRCACRALRNRPARCCTRATAVSSSARCSARGTSGPIARREVEFVERAQDRGARRAGRVVRRREMRLRGFGGPAAIFELVQQVELDGSRAGTRLRPAPACRSPPRNAPRPGAAAAIAARQRGACRSAPRSSLPLPSAMISEQPLVGRRIRRAAAASAGCAPRPRRASCAGRCWSA